MRFSLPVNDKPAFSREHFGSASSHPAPLRVSIEFPPCRSTTWTGNHPLETGCCVLALYACPVSQFHYSSSLWMLLFSTINIPSFRGFLTPSLVCSSSISQYKSQLFRPRPLDLSVFSFSGQRNSPFSHHSDKFVVRSSCIMKVFAVLFCASFLGAPAAAVINPIPIFQLPACPVGRFYSQN